MEQTEAMRRTEEALRAMMVGLEQVLPGYAITLLVAPKGPVLEPRANYISNARRDEMIAMMKEVAGRLEGRAHDAPATRQ